VKIRGNGVFKVLSTSLLVFNKKTGGRFLLKKRLHIGDNKYRIKEHRESNLSAIRWADLSFVAPRGRRMDKLAEKPARRTDALSQQASIIWVVGEK
jgi:hypothetical protein